jgi:alpha-tubulin suppressor-like RCC1 family protein
MMRRVGVFWSAGAMVATTLAALATTVASPAQADIFADWANVSAGGGQSCGIRAGGQLYCWGNDDHGQVGNGGSASLTLISSPRHIGSFSDWAQVVASSFHTCGVRKNGKLYCWGKDNAGQLGNGSNETNVTAPQRIGAFEDWASVAAISDSTCGVRKNGKLYCWGSNRYGEIGDGTGPSNAPVTTPRRIGAAEDWTSVSAGYLHTCGIRGAGNLYCWGLNHCGQVGIGGTPDDCTISTPSPEDNPESFNAPKRIGTFGDWATVDAGGDHTCGVRKNGKLYCWGSNFAGQVGNGDAPVAAGAPTRIGDFQDWATVDAGGYHNCGVRKNGKLYCWGWNACSQVGNGDESTCEFPPALGPEAPVRIGSFEDWVDPGAGVFHSCGVRANGKLYCWGTNVIPDEDQPVPAASPFAVSPERL